MNPPHSLDHVTLAKSHLSAALSLSIEAGWNQTAADWRVMLDDGLGHGFVSAAGQLVATAVALPYGPHFGWISMVLVTKSWRRRGLATALLRNCIAFLEQRGLTSALDATSDGAHVYADLGFRPGFEFCRWQHNGLQPRPGGGEALLSRPVKPDDLYTMSRHDAKVVSCNRENVLRNLLDRSGAIARIARSGRGFLLSRDGRIARQIGPVLAEDDDVAKEMVRNALANVAGSVFIDVPETRAALKAMLAEHGLTRQRVFQRMVRGEPHPSLTDPAGVYAVAGPELG